MFLHSMLQLFLSQVNYSEEKTEKLVYVKVGCNIKVFTC